MDHLIYKVIFYLLLIDSVGCNFIAWSDEADKWYHKYFPFMSRFFPATRGWTTYYLILVLFIGLILFK